MIDLENKTPLMYLGPTIRGVAKNGTVFNGGIPARLSKLAEKKPVVTNLIVSLPDIVKAQKAIDTEGTVEAVSYDRIDALTEADIKNIMEGE